MSKIDIADGFYRIWLAPEDIPKLAIIFPTEKGEDELIGLPLTLPMGWKESPPYFSVATETVADLANEELKRAPRQSPPHRLDEVSETQPTSLEATAPTTTTSPIAAPLPQPDRDTVMGKTKAPMQYWDVYVDDFIGLVQGNRSRRRDVKRVLMRALDRVLRPLHADDNPHRQEPASVKKMLKGDATWATTKLILGWIVNTIDKTLTLPTHRAERLHEILASIHKDQKRVSTSAWHQVLGELRSMAAAIPGARGLFSTLQEALRHPTDDNRRIRLSRPVHDFLDDFRWLASDLSRRPTKIAELVPDIFPATLGAVDAAKEGMGGVHFVPVGRDIVPILWRKRFPKTIQQRLVSFNNPHGDITNSDLELTGSIAQHDILAQLADIRERTIHSSYDNTPALYWQRKGSTTTLGPAAYLLRLQAIHQRHHRYVPLQDYIPGEVNVMADVCSRAWHLTDNQLLTHFNSSFPQTKPWRVCRLRRPMNFALIGALCRKRSDPASLLNAPTNLMHIGSSGMTSVCKGALTRSSVTSKTSYLSYKSSGNNTGTDGLHPAAGPWDLAQWRTPSEQWARSTPGWGPKIRDATPPAK